MSAKRRALVLDTSAFIAGLDPAMVGDETYTVPEVELELTEESTSKLRLMALIEGGFIKIIEPEPKYIEIIKSISGRIGDLASLSETDIKVLALAAQLKDQGYDVVVVTDDYSMQNTAERAGLKYAPLANLGIRYQFHWIIRCPACGKRYPSDRKEMVCDDCGTQLEKRPRSRAPAKRKYRALAPS